MGTCVRADLPCAGGVHEVPPTAHRLPPEPQEVVVGEQVAGMRQRLTAVTTGALRRCAGRRTMAA